MRFLIFAACLAFTISLTPTNDKTSNIWDSEKLFEENLSTKRIIAIGDIHGDYNNLVKILNFTNPTPSDIIITTGDTIDRGDFTIKVLDFLKQRNNTIVLLGNHELLNLQGNFDYVSQGDINSFGGIKERLQAFNSGKYWKYLMSLNITHKIGDVIFVHGGISLKVAEKYKNIENINKIFRNSEELKGNYGPLWYRDYAKLPENRICEDFYQVLNIFNAKFMVMGHTPFSKITKKCNEKMIFIDTGISYAMYNQPSALEIIQNNENTVKMTAFYPFERKTNIFVKDYL